jgi:O-methyltransferase involved in polyketide biosynthesis
MEGNDKIAFTAEAIAFMRAYTKSDRFSRYFVSPKIEKKFKIASLIIPSSYLNKTFTERINLSSDLDKIVKSYKPEQIIELACGYSPRGLLMTQQNPNLIYIETDFSTVINRKRKILGEIEVSEKIKLSKNYHLVEIDAIDANLYTSLKNLIDKKKKTLVIAETLTSYLNPREHDFLVNNIEKLFDKIDSGAYLSHETQNMLKGFFGKLLLFYRDKVAKTKSYRHFNNPKEIETYFLERGAKKVKVVKSEASKNLLYLVIRK